MYLPRLQNVGFDKSATEIKYDGIVIAAIKLKYCMLAGAFPTHSFFPTILPVFYQLFFFNIQLTNSWNLAELPVVYTVVVQLTSN